MRRLHLLLASAAVTAPASASPELLPLAVPVALARAAVAGVAGVACVACRRGVRAARLRRPGPNRPDRPWNA